MGAKREVSAFLQTLRTARAILTSSPVFVPGQKALANKKLKQGVQIMAEELDDDEEEEDEEGLVGEGRFHRTHLRLLCRLWYR